QMNLITVTDFTRAFKLVAVDPGAVFAFQVFDKEFILIPVNPNMLARNLSLIQDNIAFLATPQHKRLAFHGNMTFWLIVVITDDENGFFDLFLSHITLCSRISLI